MPRRWVTQPLRALPKVDAWIRGQLAVLEAEAGLPDDEARDLRFSPYLVIAFTGEALTGDAVFPDHFALVGPSVSARPAGAGFPWDLLDPGRRRVLVTVGTLAQDIATDSTDFYLRAAAALRPLGDRVQAVVDRPGGVIPSPPDNVLTVPQAPVLDLMPHLDAVVCHGGLNIVCESLSRAVPLVIAPIRHDQPVIAAQVAAAGAGIRVRFTRASPGQLRAAVTAVLDEPATGPRRAG